MLLHEKFTRSSSRAWTCYARTVSPPGQVMLPVSAHRLSGVCHFAGRCAKLPGAPDHHRCPTRTFPTTPGSAMASRKCLGDIIRRLVRGESPLIGSPFDDFLKRRRYRRPLTQRGCPSDAFPKEGRLHTAHELPPPIPGPALFLKTVR